MSLSKTQIIEWLNARPDDAEFGLVKGELCPVDEEGNAQQAGPSLPIPEADSWSMMSSGYIARHIMRAVEDMDCPDLAQVAELVLGGRFRFNASADSIEFLANETYGGSFDAPLKDF